MIEAKHRLEPTIEAAKVVRPFRPASKAMCLLPQRPSEPILTQAKPIASPFETSLSTHSELPMHQSTEWQLRYPPGGSTHPSYPWPTADSRLLFHTHYVPLNNGLPDVSHAPILTLPQGWRQACWSGLHPVVFDPYQQAFKLTPVGPLPLTCEEVQQGGLQQYVPGGNLHPEYGLLPVLSSFSDGSDTEVFNFEGVNWKLPWALTDGNLELGTAAEIPFLSTSVGPSTAYPSAFAFTKTSHYIEGRDCPDDVIDLEDAWRWLQDWDPNSVVTFQSTPGKSWRGSGIPLSGRTTKQPIASLMMLTMRDKGPSVEQYLVKQTRREFCPLKSVATPVYVDITLLKDVQFTIVELLTYFPFHYQWRGATNRLIKSGMTASDIANFVNMVRQLPARSLCIAGTVNSHIRGHVTSSTDSTTCYTAEHWQDNVSGMTDYPLLGLAVGLKDLPSGTDAGPLTSVIKWCRSHQRYTTMLSEVPNLLQEAGISALINTENSRYTDGEAFARHNEAVKRDRMRVLKEIRDLKEEKEIAAANQRISKKRKMQ